MRIDKIEIDGFGKLNDFSLTLSDGFNLIFGENESGKSTLCAFLLSMFYDMPNDGKRLELSESIRRKYKPWNTDRFGGRVHFTHGGKQYILEKNFGATKRSDRARLMNAASWDECGSPENAGERFFGLGREGFLKTLYITALGADAKSTGNEEILTRLSNLETSGDEDISYGNIKNALEKEQFAILTKTGKGGKLAALKEQERKLQSELNTAQRFYESVKDEERQRTELKAQIAELQIRIQTAEQAYQTAADHEAYLSQKQTAENRSMLLDRLSKENERLLKLQQVGAELLEKIRAEVTSEDIDQAKILEKQLIIFENKKEELETQMQELSEKMQLGTAKKKRSAGIVSALVFLIFAAAGIVLKNWLHPIILPLAGLALAGVIFFFMTSRGKWGGELETAQQELEKADGQRKELQLAVSALCKKYETDGLSALFNRAAEDNSNTERLKETQRQLKSCETEIKSLTESLSRLPGQEKREFTPEVINYSGSSALEIASQTKALKARLEVLTQKHYDLSVNLAKQTAADRSVPDIESDLLAVSEQIEGLTKRHAALEKASEWLERAHGEIKQNYAPRLNQKMAEIFSRLTFDKYCGVKLGEAFRLNYQNENNEIVDASYLSGGTYDLLYIALRFAALGVLFGEKIPPVILDDALLQLDDSRLKAAADFLINSGGFDQVIYFTCHKTSAKLFQNESIHRMEL